MSKYLKLFLTLTAIWIKLSGWAQAPIKQPLAGIATLTFPGTPAQAALPAGNNGNLYKLSKPTHSYVAIVFQIDTAQVAIKSAADLDSFYSGVVEGAADSTKNRKLIYLKQINVGKYKAVEFKYLDSSTDRKFSAYQRVIYLDQVAFIYNFTLYDETNPALLVEKDRFLNSFTVTKADAKQPAN